MVMQATLDLGPGALTPREETPAARGQRGSVLSSFDIGQEPEPDLAPIGQSFTGTADQYFSLPAAERTRIPNLTITGEAEDEAGYNPRAFLRDLEVRQTRQQAQQAQQAQQQALADRQQARLQLGELRKLLKRQRDLLPTGLQLGVLERDAERLAAKRNEYLTASPLNRGGLDPWDRDAAQKLGMALSVLDQVHALEGKLAEIPEAELQINRDIQAILAGGMEGLDPDTAEQALRAEHALQDEQLAERGRAKQATIAGRQLARASAKYKAAAKELSTFEESMELLTIGAEAHKTALAKGRSKEEADLAAETAKAKALEARAAELGLPELEAQLEALDAQYDQLSGLEADSAAGGEDLGEPDPSDSKLLQALRELFPDESDEALMEALKE